MIKKRTRRSGGQTITAMVESILNEGITRPAEVSREVKERYNVDVKPSHISTIKNQWKKKTGAQNGVLTAQAPVVNADVLSSAIEFVRKVGGLKTAQEALNLIRAAKEL